MAKIHKHEGKTQSTEIPLGSLNSMLCHQSASVMCLCDVGKLDKKDMPYSLLNFKPLMQISFEN